MIEWFNSTSFQLVISTTFARIWRFKTYQINIERKIINSSYLFIPTRKQQKMKGRILHFPSYFRRDLWSLLESTQMLFCYLSSLNLFFYNNINNVYFQWFLYSFIIKMTLFCHRYLLYFLLSHALRFLKDLLLLSFSLVNSIYYNYWMLNIL